MTKAMPSSCDYPLSLNPAYQPSAPRVHWIKEEKAFQLNEFAVTVTYWLCDDHWDGRLHVEIVNCTVTWYDEDEGQPSDEIVNEIVRDLIRHYYSDDRIIFEHS